VELTLKGVDGSIRWGYHTAATIRGWALERDEQGRLLTATVTHADTFRLSQRPLVFEMPHANGVTRWRIIELQISGASLSARLGQRET
jgi:hypothetical protein